MTTYQKLKWATGALTVVLFFVGFFASDGTVLGEKLGDGIYASCVFAILYGLLHVKRAF